MRGDPGRFEQSADEFLPYLGHIKPNVVALEDGTAATTISRQLGRSWKSSIGAGTHLRSRWPSCSRSNTIGSDGVGLISVTKVVVPLPR